MRVSCECRERGPLVLVVVPGASQNAIHEYTVDEARRFAAKLLDAATACDSMARTIEWLEAN